MNSVALASFCSMTLLLSGCGFMLPYHYRPNVGSRLVTQEAREGAPTTIQIGGRTTRVAELEVSGQSVTGVLVVGALCETSRTTTLTETHDVGVKSRSLELGAMLTGDLALAGALGGLGAACEAHCGTSDPETRKAAGVVLGWGIAFGLGALLDLGFLIYDTARAATSGDSETTVTTETKAVDHVCDAAPPPHQPGFIAVGGLTYPFVTDEQGRFVASLAAIRTSTRAPPSDAPGVYVSNVTGPRGSDLVVWMSRADAQSLRDLDQRRRGSAVGAGSRTDAEAIATTHPPTHPIHRLDLRIRGAQLLPLLDPAPRVRVGPGTPR